ncbi:MAG TPA: cbb3-type cytochrome c oxidase subunit II, partial [Opitutus sp.]|nr:cbb3-type cytochrome c oxidase subunit II [Opitutus sp.]
MLGLGAGGIAGAMGAARAFRAQRAGTLLRWAFRACAISGLLALAARGFAAIAAVGVLSGASLGALTVTLAATLRQATGLSRLGLCIGAGTGLAYAWCNIPWIFRASPAMQTLLAVAAVGTASLLPRLLFPPPFDSEARITVRDRWSDVARWVVILLALVWLDSAAFYIIQHNPSLRMETWSESATLFANAAIHLVAAIVAGLLLDRGKRALVAGFAIVTLGVAGLILNGTLPRGLSANGFYTAGVSLYSVVLVEYPARTGRVWIAALVFGVAGWMGSAFGIGMAQDLAQIPTAFIAAAVLIVMLALFWRTRAVARVAVMLVAMSSGLRADDVTLGREVYIAEGCIHCHTQYLRPRVATEVLNWGPAKPLREALAAAPPLFGTRRQGPDLSQVGNRRSAEWNRLHLKAPQQVSPGSRMPSYAHLFERGDERGDALVAYLASLGSGTLEQRRQQIVGWKPEPGAVIAPDAAARLFAHLCAQCHGQSGRGDGVLAAQLSLRPPDWERTSWRQVGTTEDLDVALSRIIKFGLPGLPMAGHEYLTDSEIVGLVRYVQTLQKSGRTASSMSVQP